MQCGLSLSRLNHDIIERFVHAFQYMSDHEQVSCFDLQPPTWLKLMLFSLFFFLKGNLTCFTPVTLCIYIVISNQSMDTVHD